jgi:hypothetical protein
MGHYGERRGLPYPKAKLFVKPDRCDVGSNDVQEYSFRSPLDVRDQCAHECRGQPLTTMVWPGAHGADLPPTVQVEPLAGHRDECAFVPDT